MTKRTTFYCFMLGVMTTLVLWATYSYQTKYRFELQIHVPVQNLVEVGKVSDSGSNSTAAGYCSMQASNLGSNQKVISYCLFGDYTNYGMGLPSILEAANVVYPGWNVWVYAEFILYEKEFGPLLKKHGNFFVCDVAKIPGPPHDIRYMEPRMWRLAALADEQVDVAIFRDIDAVIIPREVDAVDEFLASGKTLHVMRDNFFHPEPILAGMFGVRQTEANRDQLRCIREKLFRKGRKEKNRYNRSNFDQIMLNRHLKRPLANSTFNHDSFHCNSYKEAVPFPTKRDAGMFIGNKMYLEADRNTTIDRPCPVACRPKDHLDWEYC